MPRDHSSKSRSRSLKRSKRYRKGSSQSERESHKKSKQGRVSREQPNKLAYSITAKSDIKYHVRYDKIRVHHTKDEEVIMGEVQNVLQKQFGKISLVNKIQEEENSFSFGVGFKYDIDALRFVKQCGYINSKVDKLKLVAKPTPIFQFCIPMIKEAKKEQSKGRSPSPSKKHRKSSSSQKSHKKRRSKHSSSWDSRDKSKDRSTHKKKYNQKTLWIFGIPWTIKGKQVGDFVLQRHPQGPFQVSNWRWVRIKNSNCEFMEVTLDSKKAEKLLSVRQQTLIEGYPIIITNGQDQQSMEIVKDLLKQFQFRITFPEKINPASLYKSLIQHSKVVQIVSCNPLVDGCSDTFTVTLSSASRAREVRRLNVRSQGIKIEEIKGQLVYRPTKHSKLSDNE